MKTARSMACRNKGQIERAKARKPKPQSQFVINPASHHRRGNPLWGKAGPIVVELSEFEKLVAKLGLAPEQWAASPELKRFARKYRSTRYVPEELLEAWGLSVGDEATLNQGGARIAGVTG